MFVDYYVTHAFNGTEAVLNCGAYPGTTTRMAAGAMAAVILKRPRVLAMIHQRTEARRKRWEATSANVIRELAAISFSNMSDYCTVDPETGKAYVDLGMIKRMEEVDPDQARMMWAAIQELTSETEQEYRAQIVEGAGLVELPITITKTKLKLYDKKSALELLGKHLGVFREVPPPPVTINVTVNTLREKMLGNGQPVLQGEVVNGNGSGRDKSTT